LEDDIRGNRGMCKNFVLYLSVFVRFLHSSRYKISCYNW